MDVPSKMGPVQWIGALVLAVILPGCSSYEGEFRLASDAIAETRPVDFTGPWSGEWRSQANGHHGPLWCIVEPAEASGQYRFRYRAGWGNMLRGNWTQTLPVKRSGAASTFAQSMDLGKLGGVYSIDASVTPTEFDANYRSTKGDHGTMTLRRP